MKRRNNHQSNKKPKSKSLSKYIPCLPPSDAAASPNSESVPSPPITTTTHKPKSPPKSEKMNEKKRSLLPLSNIHENCSTKAQTIEDIKYLLGRKFTVPLNDDEAEVQERCLLFFDKNHVDKMVDKEINNHLKNNNASLAIQVYSLTGNLEETIAQASKYDKLNDWLVAMSASISREFWSKTALLYAKQLEASKEFTQAAFYYLSVHYIHEAAKVLVKGGLFKESLILAKSCAPFDTELIQSILNAWAKSKEGLQDWEFAAKIYVSNFDSKQAARCLSQRKDDPNCETLIKILDSVAPFCNAPGYM